MVVLQPEDTGILITIGGDVLGGATGSAPGGSTGSGGLDSVKGKLMSLKGALLGLMGAAAAMTMLAFRFSWQVQRSQIAGKMLENAQIRTQMAQERYNQIVQKYGAKSEEAVKAARELNIAQDNLTRSHTRTQMTEERQWLMILPSALGGLTQVGTMISQFQHMQSASHGLSKFANQEQQNRDVRQMTMRSTQLVAQVAKYVPVIGIAAFVIGEGITFAEMAQDQQAQADASKQLDQMLASPDATSPSDLTSSNYTINVNVSPGMNEKQVSDQAWSQVRSRP